MKYKPEDIAIIDDPINVIRRRPTLYGGDSPRSARLAAELSRDLIYGGDLSVIVDRVEGWWLIICQKDWLYDDREDKSNYWYYMIPTPQFAPESIRTEVLLTALSKGLVTLAQGRITWIVHDVEIPAKLNDYLRKMIESKFSGRVVAFIAD